MLYKTIALELLEELPELHEELRSSRTLLAAMDTCAVELKASHEAWKDRLGQARPGSDPRQIAAEAMELATLALKDRLHSALPKDETEPTLDQAMEFLRRHTPPV